MTKIIKITERTSLALHAMLYLATFSDKSSVKELSEVLKASQAHLSKVMQELVRSQLLISHTGPGGGFSLAREPEKISLLEIFEAIEGEFDNRSCLLEKPICIGNKCIMGDVIKKANQELLEYLTKTNLLSLKGILNGETKRDVTEEDQDLEESSYIIKSSWD